MRFFRILFTVPVLFASFTTAQSRFVVTKDGKFQVNGSDFNWMGTTAYWLPSLNTEQDIINTLANISTAGYTVVRTWAFNDVETTPTNGTWFQLINNGSTVINTGSNGLQKLDMVLKHAERFGLYVILSLTNNWNPRENLDRRLESDIQARTLWDRDVTPGTNNSLPRNFLSNDYGGMDVYVRQFGYENHDDFYTTAAIKNAFKNYTTQIVSRYKNSSAVFSWEIANDPRCSSTLGASSNCETRTVTRWHAEIARHIRSVDPNHLVSSGNHGFFCFDCPKLSDSSPSPPSPSPSPSPSSSPQSRRSLHPLTKKRLLQERREQWKRTRVAAIQSRNLPTEGIRVRGQWDATPTRRQVGNGVGSAYDGSAGVDSQDILAIKEISFSSFQLFPDQNSYGVDDPNLSPYDNMVQNGVEWITAHARAAQSLRKPVALTGFGLVTQANAPSFVPFNSSTPPFTNQSAGVTDEQRDAAYDTWSQTGVTYGLQGIMQYQWGQTGLTTQPGTTISPNINGTTQSTNVNQTEAGQSPNDGYAIFNADRSKVQRIFSDAV
ncbi:hypothetical protein E1B28_008802 [Marasmius oreades]|uniref:mannan endo-1,4-beta-mannosidase n=1 Tax=Marasmius oreades TaxID=181124 RepID=A0A9P7USH2_9AGAR|nr:uncharacterized protein E1B28_008802 [Marasmius oreades]KAG7092448.1 hypothetical protein E1B28_008802 [Marasmius oreades]